MAFYFALRQRVGRVNNENIGYMTGHYLENDNLLEADVVYSRLNLHPAKSISPP